MRLRDLISTEVDSFGTIDTGKHGFLLFVFLKDGRSAHVGNSVDQPYEFPSSSEACGFAKHYFPQIPVEPSPFTIAGLEACLSLPVGVSRA